MNDSKIVINRTISAPIERVWQAWTNEECLLQWLAPQGRIVSEAHVALQEEGTYSITMGGNKKEKVTVAGRYKTIEKPNTLVFSWKWEHQEEETQVTILLQPVSPIKTELTLIHEGFENLENRKMHAFGWKDILTNLEEALKGGEQYL